MKLACVAAYSKREKRGDHFCDLPPDVKIKAETWLVKFRNRWGWNLPNWRPAILVGQARRLAINPPDSAWGRSMLAKGGGKALQRTEREGKAILVQGGMKLLRASQNAPRAAAARVGMQSHSKLNNEELFLGLTGRVSPADSIGGPAPEAHAMHILVDPPGCRCYYCAFPNHES
jgi:hypothetical protein